MEYKTIEKYTFGIAITLIALAFYACRMSLKIAGCYSTIIYFILGFLTIYSMILCATFYKSAYEKSIKAKRIFKILTIVPLVYLLPFIIGQIESYVYEKTLESLMFVTIGIIYIGLVVCGNIIAFREKRKIKQT